MDAHVRRAPEDVVDDRRAKGPAQTTIERCFRSLEEKKRVDSYVADWFYECGIPFNAAKTRSFEVMLEAVGQYEPSYKGPSYHDLRVSLLLSTKEKVKVVKTNYQAYWRRYGCTLMSDGWTDRRGRHLINFLVNCPEGTYFMGSVDASSQIQDATMLSELFDSKIREIGTECVVQVVTDNASNYKAAGRILMEKRPTLFWSPCAAHCIDLMLEDIGKLPPNKIVIKKARMIKNFIYRHTRLLEAVRSTIGGDLVRHSVTRFATSFLTLQSLLKHEEKLKLFFVSPSWNASNLAKTESGKQVVETVLSTVFWNGVRDCLKGGKPLIAVLRLVDGDERPAMPEVYVAMEEAKQKIKEHFDNKERLYKKIIEIVEKRWTNQMEQQLYRAALFLNPGKYFEYEEKHNDDAWKFQDAFNDVITRLVPDQELQDRIAEQGTSYKASRNCFGKPQAIRQRTTLNPMDWWGAHGGPNVDLTKVALRILGLCCSSSSCERNWSTFEFIHTKKRNRLEHQRLSDLVYIQYNRRLQARFQERREKGRNYNPLVLDELDWSNEWMVNKPEAEDALVFYDDILTWNDVERAIGTGARNLRSGAEANLQIMAEREEDLDHFFIVNDDEDIEDNYGQNPSTSNQPSTCNANDNLLDDDSS
ncbi:hypothetical protein KSP39_PZI022500 [Platanthera zijinensis]|uniref:Uncharacterized protein n=1 Tax=Platanthera zijinensis TaxID=2320716 RepID=A0AAP0AVM5_9ASPA